MVDFEPGRSITIRSTAGSFPITVRRRVEPLDPATTRVHAEIMGKPGRFFRLAAPLVHRLAQRSVDGDYDRLVEVLRSVMRRIPRKVAAFAGDLRPCPWRSGRASPAPAAGCHPEVPQA
jgi:hypothetical protein